MTKGHGMFFEDAWNNRQIATTEKRIHQRSNFCSVSYSFGQGDLFLNLNKEYINVTVSSTVYRGLNKGFPFYYLIPKRCIWSPLYRCLNGSLSELFFCILLSSET